MTPKRIYIGLGVEAVQEAPGMARIVLKPDGIVAAAIKVVEEWRTGTDYDEMGETIEDLANALQAAGVGR